MSLTGLELYNRCQTRTCAEPQGLEQLGAHLLVVPHDFENARHRTKPQGPRKPDPVENPVDIWHTGIKPLERDDSCSCSTAHGERQAVVPYVQKTEHEV